MRKKIIVLIIFISSLSTFGQAGSGTKWVGTWAAAPQLVESGNMPPSPGLTNNSLRQIVRVSIGGDTIRLKLSNEFSSNSVTIKSVQIAASAGSSKIDTATNKVLKFNGSSEVVINRGNAVTSDPIPFILTPRMDVAITIYYGQTSSTVTGHPGSRTTSYIISGNNAAVKDFTGAVTTDHWYNINSIEVIADSFSACVAVLGNSITDGRGSTTNLQNRWTDIFSESLLKDSTTDKVGVLNMGLGGNSVLAGGLGPTGVSRFDRDILNQAGVRWAIVFEGVNDIGSVKNTEASVRIANNLIDAYKQMIIKAHNKNIRIYGGTIMPFKGNSYYNQYSEECRNAVNKWIRTKGNFDACIDFDRIMRDPQDTAKLPLPPYQNDGLHPDAAGYKLMGESVDVDLFTGADTVYQQGNNTKPESFWFEAERFVKSGSNFNIVDDGLASNGKYITVKVGVQSLNAAPVDTVNLISIPFAVTKDTTYNFFARLNCPTYDDDSYWVKIDDGAFTMCNGLVTSGWAWMKLVSGNLLKGNHKLIIGYREDGACMDKLCISNDAIIPTGMGGVDSVAVSVNSIEMLKGYSLKQNYPNPFNPSTEICFTIPEQSYVSLKVYDTLGRVVSVLRSEEMHAGTYLQRWDAKNIASGVYFCCLETSSFIDTKKLVLLR
jgi:lysophospholipase L1-like esterase